MPNSGDFPSLSWESSRPTCPMKCFLRESRIRMPRSSTSTGTPGTPSSHSTIISKFSRGLQVNWIDSQYPRWRHVKFTRVNCIFRVFWCIFQCIYRGCLWILHPLYPPRAWLLDQERAAQHSLHHFWGNEEGPALSDQADGGVPGQDPHGGGGGEAGRPSVLQKYEKQQSCQQGRVRAHLSNVSCLLGKVWLLICIFSEGPGTEKKGSFMRKGETGDWRSKLSEEQVSIYRSGLLTKPKHLKWWIISLHIERLRESEPGSRDSFKELT